MLLRKGKRLVNHNAVPSRMSNLVEAHHLLEISVGGLSGFPKDVK
jgi:hypothetical protein